jgi:uncharacterized damage-inducible protein DinB
MLRGMIWADHRILDMIRNCAAAQAEALPLLGHVLRAEHIWLSRIMQREAAYPVWPQWTVDECARVIDENAAGYRDMLAPLTDADLSKRITYHNLQGKEFTTPLIDILTHVVIHGSYHRGQVAKVIGRAGVPAVSSDFIIFARDVEPI